ncbi:MAG: patatin-like phospholipase family protein [Deltaproteobacteria bacterium]|nr:patatin-like phospholipase family protein [Deltaproteobacteria bacterium]MBI3386559.1 patatin-like phospholipase family protein [Deltaproteobacteria bacterium]
MQPRPEAAPRHVALVMSGGGARGAYEAGVLSYLFGDLAARLGRPIHFDIVTGTSVGAVHACYVAATQQEPDAGTRLTEIWRSLSFERIFEIGATDVFRVPWRLLGFGGLGDWLPASDESAPKRLPGLFDTESLEALVLGRIDWAQLRRNIDEGALEALAIAATEVATGRSVVFVDNQSQTVPRWARDPFVIARAARIDADYALASAAIPLVFPAVRIDRTYYCDGGLRLNTPLSPALRLGADRVLVIGLRYPRSPAEEDRIARRRAANYASPTYLVGKALNALLLDRIEYDVDRLRLFNAILDSGVRSYGADFLVRINEPIIAQRNTPYRIVRDLFLRPSKDLGAIAGECLRHQPRSHGLRDWLSRNVARYAARGAMAEADLLSYLFFDRCYAEHLIDLGRHDAEQAADELIEFLSIAD